VRFELKLILKVEIIDRALAMRQEADRAESNELRLTYTGMADEWDAMATKVEQIEHRLKH
jgi:hypothetical protein